MDRILYLLVYIIIKQILDHLEEEKIVNFTLFYIIIERTMNVLFNMFIEQEYSLTM